MSFAPNTNTGAETFTRPDALLRVPVGLASPLWGLFAGAAMTGAAWWWMTRWAQPENLEAMFGGALTPTVEPEAPAPAVEAVIEAVADPQPALAAAVPEVAPETVLDALIEAPAAPAPVGGEAAPISPVLEVLAPEVADLPASPTPKPRRPAAPKPV